MNGIHVQPESGTYACCRHCYDDFACRFPGDNRHTSPCPEGCHDPKRIQLRRTRGWRKPPGAVVVARPGPWGNKYRVGNPGIADAATAVALFENDVWVLGIEPEIRAALRGKDLACWCRLDQPCHADVLLRVANQVT